jgi:hypothetical protein
MRDGFKGIQIGRRALFHTTVIENGSDITIANPKGRKIRQSLKSIGKKKSSKKHDRKQTETD